MKHICTILLSILCSLPVFAQQPANTLRAGGSVIVKRQNNHEGKDSFFFGGQFQVEYSRRFTSFFSLDASIARYEINHSSLNYWSESYVQQFSNVGSYFASVKGIFTPFEKAKWFKTGAGAFAEYSSKYSSHINSGYDIYRVNKMYFGFNVPVRFYIIDSQKFDLYAFYDLVVRIDDTYYTNKKIYIPHDTFGLMFGVKF